MEENNLEQTSDTIKEEGQKKKKIILTIIMVACAIVFIVSGIMLADTLLNYKEAQDEYSQLIDEVAKPAGDGSGSSAGRADPDMEKVKAINEEAVGWIRFENIAIDYPIVKTDNNDYYLNHTFKKEENSSGAIFVDYENKGDFSDKNTVIYGHNMKDKSMFALLNDYKDENYFKENPYFYIYDSTGKHFYKIYSAYTCNLESQIDTYTYTFASDEEFEEYISMTKRRSMYDTGVTPDSKSTLVTLSTCTANSNYRMVIQAVKIN